MIQIKQELCCLKLILCHLSVGNVKLITRTGKPRNHSVFSIKLCSVLSSLGQVTLHFPTAPLQLKCLIPVSTVWPNKKAMIISVNIESPRSLYLTMQHGPFSSQSSQPRPRSTLVSETPVTTGQNHFYTNALIRLWWRTLSG